MTDGAQQELRRTMEVYSKTTRFALACNNSDQIIGVFVCQCVCYLYVNYTQTTYTPMNFGIS